LRNRFRLVENKCVGEFASRDFILYIGRGLKWRFTRSLYEHLYSRPR